MTGRLPSRMQCQLAAFALSLCVPGVAQAHVKWFCGPINTSLPPVPASHVLTPFFAEILGLFTALVGLGAALDALAARILPWRYSRSDRSGIIAEAIIRLGLAIYAFCLWRNLAVVLWADRSVGSILTPDLLDNHRAIGLLQLAIAGAVLIPRLSIIAAIGLAALYAIGVVEFGQFYMIDYLFFPGLAAYVALSDPLLKRYARLRLLRAPILVGSLSVSLMWTAVEKFLFPQWTILVLLLHPAITAGHPFATVATVAGFVEFSLAFYLLVGREILGRIDAILLMIVFVIAMPEFGMVDVVGHIPVIIILLVALIEGETRLQATCRGRVPNAFTSCRRVVALYVATLAVLMLLYYNLHALSVWM